jgi:four helix bundle protein
MPKIQKFEDLIAWQKARELYRNIHEALSQGPCSRDYVFRSQMTSAALSTMSNIAEGFERGTDRELHQFLIIAGASNGEVRSQLYAALDVNYIDRECFDRLFDLCSQTGRLITAFRKSLKVSRNITP